MLKWIELQNVGPAPEMRMDLSERLNVITGDNGLGKTFLLDVCWWALTRTWAGTPAIPFGPRRATIEYVVKGKAGDAGAVKSVFRPLHQDWPGEAKRPAIPGIVIYLKIDGGFSVWDPARNYWRKDSPERPAAYHFDNRQIWEGLKENGTSVCEGLERDWVSWQKGKEPQFEVFKAVLNKLSPPLEKLQPGTPMRVFVGEGFDRPTLQFGGEQIPVIMASAGIRRILALAYLLVWAWHEHRATAKLLGKAPESRLTVLIDEPETHLHPSWQRRIVPALLDAVNELRKGYSTTTQFVMATHSPLLLASLEPAFDENTDALFNLRAEGGTVKLETIPWAKQGDTTNWLVSETFGLHQARSFEAEKVIEAAEAFMRSDRNELPVHLKTQADIQRELERVLAGHDSFWPRWIGRTEKPRGKK